MGDYTGYQCHFQRKATDAERKAIEAFAEEHNLDYDEFEGIPSLTDYERRVGCADELVEPLIALGVPFWSWEDPKYEWLGDAYLWHPDLGLYGHSCDSDGNPVFTAAEVKVIMANPAPDTLLPTAWEEAFGRG